jgi:hypothetical protein
VGNEVIKIIDVIARNSPYSNHVSYYLLLDRMPCEIYKQTPMSKSHRGETRYRFTSSDSGFYSFLEGSSSCGDAFCGRKFSIELADGKEFECNGDVWSCSGSDDDEETAQVGIGTLETLGNCYVFSSSNISKKLLDGWLSENTPSDHYYKYDHRFTMDWLNAHGRSFGREVGSRRAKQLRRMGRTVWKNEKGKQCWSPFYEQKKQEIIEIHGEAA